MKNSEYWANRIANNTWKTYNSLEEKNRALLEMYQEASLNISEELYRLSEKIKTATPTLSDMYKYNRLNGLKNNIEDQVKELGENVESFGKRNMMQGMADTYDNVMLQLGKIEFDGIPHKVMEEMLKRPWQGSTFSERLWKNTQVLATNLNEILVTGITQGKTVTEMAIQLNNRMNQGFNVSHRLIRTETMHYLNESAFKGYKDAGCEEVQLWAAVDERTCPTCGVRHGNIYRIKDCPTLPLHANCRCTILPIVDDNEAKKDHDTAKEDMNNEFNQRSSLDNGLNNKNRKLSISKQILIHSNRGDFTNPKNPKKIKPGEIRLKTGGHGELNIKLLNKDGIEYNIVKCYDNGVRIGNIPSHKRRDKATGTGQTWFPKHWGVKKIEKAGEYVANLKDNKKYLIEEFIKGEKLVSLYKYANYDNVTVAVCYDFNRKMITTIFPDGKQRLLGGEKDD